MSASSNRPSRRSAAPVKAPFSWPNSSLSSRVSGSAAQLTAMNGLPRRGERSWMALATSSLPVPLSPWMSTVLETGAICSILTSTSWIGALSPKMPVRSCSSRRSISRRAVATASSGATGFIMVSVAPSRPTRSARSESVGSSRARVLISASRARAASWRACGSWIPPVRMTSSGLSRRTVPARVVERGEHGGREAGRLERRVERHGGGQVVHGDQNAGCHAGETNRRASPGEARVEIESRRFRRPRDRERREGAMTDESGTIALVTGAAHGIGLEVCRQLAERGWTVVLTARGLERAREAAEGLAGLEGKVHARALDVADDASPRALAADLGWALGRVDVLVNNAGQAADWSETAGTADLREAHAVMEANLFGAWRTTQALLPLLRRSRRGRIVNVSSGAGSHVDARFGLAAVAAATSYAVSRRRSTR